MNLIHTICGEETIINGTEGANLCKGIAQMKLSGKRTLRRNTSGNWNCFKLTGGNA